MEDRVMKSQRFVLFVLVSVMVVALLAACSGGATGTTSTSSDGQTINVSATEFQYTPNTFEGKVGQKITFNLTNKGTVEHTLVILSLDGSQELAKVTTQPGETKPLEFTPKDAGTYPIECDIAGHKEAGMTGQLVVK
jgi:uncharacterized cupredoxin-like copper-binding protein